MKTSKIEKCINLVSLFDFNYPQMSIIGGEGSKERTRMSIWCQVAISFGCFQSGTTKWLTIAFSQCTKQNYEFSQTVRSQFQCPKYTLKRANSIHDKSIQVRRRTKMNKAIFSSIQSKAASKLSVESKFDERSEISRQSHFVLNCQLLWNCWKGWQHDFISSVSVERHTSELDGNQDRRACQSENKIKSKETKKIGKKQYRYIP